MRGLVRLGFTARKGFGRVTPDPFVLAIALTVLSLVAAGVFGEGSNPVQRWMGVLGAWHVGGGLWGLLAFAMQASLMLVLGTALAEAPPIKRAIRAIASWARTPRELVGLVALVAISLGLLNWSLSLIGAALLARQAGLRARERGWSLHYPLLCAAAYSGLMVWHGGLSGTAPLKVTGAEDLREVLGPELAATVGTIPLDRTLLSPLNLVVGVGLLVLGPLLFWAMTPRQGEDPDAWEMSPEAAVHTPAIDDGHAREESGEEGWLTRFERSPVVLWLLALPMAAALTIYIVRNGLGRLDLNTVNLALWALAMALHGRPDRFVAACQRGVSGCTGILLQFPLYAGIMAILASSGLSDAMTRLVFAAGEHALVPLTFVSAGLLNLFVPSGGGQWAVQGPIITQAALDLGVPVERAVMALAYGDQWTNMLQPFWALPLLAITGVRARDIVGYTTIWMVVGGLWMLAALVLMP